MICMECYVSTIIKQFGSRRSYSSSSSSAASSSAASSSPSGVSGSPSFLPGLTPHHLGSLALGRLFLSPYVLVSVLLSYLENMWILGGWEPQKASGSRPFLMALFLGWSFLLSLSSFSS